MSKKHKQHRVKQEISPAPIPQGVQVPREAIFPPAPPDRVFKNRKNRDAPSISVAELYVTYLFEEVKYLDDGIFSHYIGVNFPRKGIPFAQAVYSINATKRFLVSLMRSFIRKDLKFVEKFLVPFNEMADMSMIPYYLEDQYYCKTAKTVRAFVRSVLISLKARYDIADKTAEILAMIFEFDDAYRYRLQDLMTETSATRLLLDFKGEVQRLLELYAEREMADAMKVNEQNGKYTKFQSFARVLRIMWWIPRVRKAIKAGLKEITFKDWQLDEADIYHTYLYADYNVGGETLEERIKTYLEIYGNDESKAPKRVQVKVN